MGTLMEITLGITVAGILNTVYLTYHNIMGTRVKCLFFPQEWCDKVTSSKYSKTFGMPNPFLGLGMLVMIFALLYSYAKGSIPLWSSQVLIVFGFLFSMYFLYLQAFVIRAFCTWCVVSAIIFSLLFGLQFYI
jgi:uncharacterized membrane protein